MTRYLSVATGVFVLAAASATPVAQINFPKTGYYVGMGDSVAAGEGSLPVTNGYVYALYQLGVFGSMQQTDFANVAARGARSWDLRDHQVPQVLCALPRATVVTITSGANDFFRGDTDIVGIAQRVAESVNLLLNNDTGAVAMPVLDPVTRTPCPALQNVTILVSNYYRIPHPVPVVAAQIDSAIIGYDQALRFWLSLVPVPAGSRVAVVDLYTPSLGRTGLVTLERRLGYAGLLEYDPHPTNLGHSFVAAQFQKAWEALQ